MNIAKESNVIVYAHFIWHYSYWEIPICQLVNTYIFSKEENIMFKGHFCAGVSAHEASKMANQIPTLTPSSCKGDSGGPLTIR